MGFVFQAFHVLPYLSVAENVGLPLALRGESPAGGRERVAAMLESVGLARRERSKPRELSGGELQRVAISPARSSRALVRRRAYRQPRSGDSRQVIKLLRDAVTTNGAACVLATRRAARLVRGCIWRLTLTDSWRRKAAMSIDVRTLGATFAIARAVTGGVRAFVRGRTLLTELRSRSLSLSCAVEIINRAAVNELSTGLATLSGDADIGCAGRAPASTGTLSAASRSSTASPSRAPSSNRCHGERSRRHDARRRRRVSRCCDHASAVGATRDRMDALRGDTLFPSAAAASWLGVDDGDTVVAAGRSTLTLRRRYVERQRGAALRGDGHRCRSGCVRIARPADAHRPARIAGHRRRKARATRAGTTAARTCRSIAAGRHGGHRAAVARVSRESQRARARRAVHRQHARFRDANAFGRATATAVRAAASGSHAVGSSASSSRTAALGVVGAHRHRRPALAWIALREFGPDLGAGFFRGRAVVLGFEPLPILAFGTLGLLAAIIGSALPAREAALASPAAALKASDADLAAAPARWPAWVLIATGAAATFLPAVTASACRLRRDPLIVVGGILAMPGAPQCCTPSAHPRTCRRNLPSRTCAHRRVASRRR